MADLVTCVCGNTVDRDLFAQCGVCTRDLWELTTVFPATSADETPARDSSEFSGAEPTTLDRPRAPATSVRLEVSGRSLQLARGDVVIMGRDDDLSSGPLFREHDNVSRYHASMRFDGAHLFVTDVSKNGTFVNEVQIPSNRECEIPPGQSLRFAADVPIEIDWIGQ